MPADGSTIARDPEIVEPEIRQEPRPTAPPRPRRRPVRLILFLLLPVVLIAGLYWYVTGGAIVTGDDAYIDAEKTGISTDVAGFLRELDVHENQHVTQGQMLFQLGGRAFRIRLADAQAQVGEVRDQLNAEKASYGQMQAEIKEAEVELAYNQREFQRQAFLGGQHVASAAQLDAARRDLDASEQKIASLHEQLLGIAASLNGDPNAPVEQNPKYLAAVAQRDEAQREVNDTYVRAPFSGIVTDVPAVAVGRYLPASTVAFYLVDTDHVWVEANPKETELTWVRPGQAATVTVDTYPGQKWRGTVASISPAAAQEFSLLPSENTSGNWVKVVERIPIRVRVDTSDSSLPPLRAGMSVEVAIDTGHPRGWPHFITALFGGH